ncbi:MAG: protein phosphatase 2C domain-containing protein [Gemmatimonadota bacterium]|nr:protein phosphatase 2C domain-containing protein [Gemmatimonadota bacterium]MDH3367429.1 protein phosphatase 2C domain-containing protein [Gemmatimonadota bacterium]MDH3477480.1 protein phosphatase 2C domain-containing protein [Gemmatimonadota bacterium]MDH3571148.1 protein phosphatase 2C domain-containing protein [Gemmatimonadota bacterium]MDH5548698.1 protein phosphatase 2C domain-containing protein [Gemmatimonadota bacterium]
MLMFEGVAVDVHGATDVGKVRRENQDQFLIAALHKVVEIHGTSIPASYRRRFDSGAKALLLLVADGVGGRPGGEEASSRTLDAIMGYVTTSMRCFYKLDEQVPQDLLSELANVVQQSHDTLRSMAQAESGGAGGATTLTMVHVLWPRAYVVQIGDSRCYHLRGSRLLQVTRDQTLAQDLVDHGALEPEEAARSPFAYLLVQAIGGDTDIQPVISKVDLEPRDTLLLCTDGLTAHVRDEEIAESLHSASSAREASERLIGSAIEGGGTDNITVVVTRFA